MPHTAAADYLVSQAVSLALDDPKAAQLYRWAVDIDPDNVGAINGLGRVAIRNEQWDTAIACFSKCCSLKPNASGFVLNMAVALDNKGSHQKSLEWCNRALALDDSAWLAWHQRSVTLRHLERYLEALSDANRAVSMCPDVAEVITLRAHIHFAMGEWAKGWADWEHRKSVKTTTDYMAQFPGIPRWEGQDLRGKNLLVFGEDGLGDQIMMARWLPILQDRGAEIYFGCSRVLEPLFDGQFHIARTTGNFDYWIGLNSVPHVSGVPDPPAPIDLSRYAASYVPHDKLRVGICWKGDPGTPVDHLRPKDLKLWRPLLDLPGMEFVSLQYGAEAPRGCQPMPPVSHVGDTASLIGSLDLVITADTMIAHLAASIGTPTYMLLYRPPEWRWASEAGCEGTLWYPAMRVFHQLTPGDWASVFRYLISGIKNSSLEVAGAPCL